MPLKAYVCESCGEGVEVLCKFSETKETCDKCGGALRPTFHSPALFWGKGWGNAPFCFHRKFAYPHYDGKKP